MTKKRRSLFIVLGVVCVCVLSCAFVLTGCGNKHKYGDSWTYDETSHWHQCTKHDDDADDVEDKEKHTFVDVEDGVITEATCETAGEKKVVCSVCGYETTQTVAALEHTFTITDAEKDITWKWADDNKSATATAVCDVCKKDISLDVTMSSAVNDDGDTVYTATVTINGKDYTSTQTVTGSTQEPGGEEETKYTVTVTGTGLQTGTTTDYVLSLDITDGLDGGEDVFGSATLTASLSDENGTVGGAVAVWTVADETYATVDGGVVTAVTGGETTVTVTFYAADDTAYATALASATITVTVTDSRTVEKVTLPIYVNFADSSTYSWIEAGTPDSDGKATVGNGKEYSYGDLTLVTSTGSNTSMTIQTTNNRLTTGGDASKSKGRYFIIDLSDYVGSEIEISVEFRVNSSTVGNSSNVYLMDTIDTAPDATAENWIAKATSTKVAGDSGTDTAFLTYTVKVTGGSSVFYVVCDANTHYYTISIKEAGDESGEGETPAPGETEDSLVAVTFDEDIEHNGATFENTSSLKVEYDGTTGKYVLSGYANVMTGAQAEAFGGDAKVGTPYVVYGILLQPGDTISGIASEGGSWTYPVAGDDNVPNEADYYVFIVSVSDVSVGGRQDKTYTVTTVDNDTITITIDFTDVKDPEAATDGAVTVDGTFDMIVTNGDNTYQAFVENADGFKIVLNGEGEFVLTGIANKLTDDQAYVFYGGNTNKAGGEDFIAYGITLEDGDTIINLNTGWTETYAENGGLYIMVSTVTGNFGYYTYAIISGEGTVTIVKVSFAGVIIAKTATGNEVTVSNVSAAFTDRAPEVTFTNTCGFTYTYADGEFVLRGKASVMTECQAKAFVGEDPNGVASAGDYYIVIGIALTEGQTIYNLQSGYFETYADNNDMYYMILRLTKTSGHRMFALVDTTTEDDGSTTVTSVTLIKVTFAGVDITWATGISLTEGAVTGNNNQNVTFSNESDLVADTTVDDSGNFTITVTGTASTMSTEQANDFWAGVAAGGDAYIVVTVTFRENETVSWVSSAGDTRTRTVTDYPNGTFDMVIRISGNDLSDEIKAGTLTFTITDSHGETVTYTVDFSALIADRRVVMATSEDNLEVKESVSLSTQNLEIIESANAEGQKVYTLTGEASSMSSEIATWFGNAAAAGDLYVVFKVYVDEGYTISFKTTSKDKTFTRSTDSTDFEDDGYIIIVWRLTGVTSTGAAVGKTEVTFTISYEGTTVETFVVAFDISNMPQGETKETELPSVDISFTTDGSESYAWIETVNNVTKSNSSYSGVIKSTPGTTTNDGLLTIVGTSGLTETEGSYSISSTPMYIRSDKQNNLDTGGATANGSRYFAINLNGSYVGKYLSVSVAFASTSSSEVRSLLLSSTQNVSKISETSIIAYASAGSNGATFSYVMQITEAGTLYLAWTGELLISAVKVEVLEEATLTAVPTAVTLTSSLTEDAYTVGTSSPMTVTAAVTVEDGTYAGGYTWDVTYSGAGSVFYFVANSDGTITITPVDAGTITVTYRCWDAAQVTETLTITVTNPYTITLADNQSTITVTGSDSSNVTSNCTFTDSTSTVTVDSATGTVTAGEVEEETTVTVVVTLTGSNTVIGEVKITLTPAANDEEP